MEYHPAFICENGHVVSSFRDQCSNKYCKLCGAAVIAHCPSCGTVIQGDERGSSGGYRAPGYCHACGQPYPWVERSMQAVAELLAEDEMITPDECNRLIEVLPDTLVETPRTQLAAARARKALKHLGSITADALRQFLIDCACDLVKKQIGL